MRLAAKLEQERLDIELARRLDRSNNDREVGQIADGFLESLTAAAEVPVLHQPESAPGVQRPRGSPQDNPKNVGLNTEAPCAASYANPEEVHDNQRDDEDEAGAPFRRCMQGLGLNERRGFPAAGAPNPDVRAQRTVEESFGNFQGVSLSTTDGLNEAAGATPKRNAVAVMHLRAQARRGVASSRLIMAGRATFSKGPCYACLDFTDVVHLGCKEQHKSCYTCLRKLLITALGDRALLPPKCCDTRLDPSLWPEVLDMKEERLLAERIQQVRDAPCRSEHN